MEKEVHYMDTAEMHVKENLDFVRVFMETSNAAIIFLKLKALGNFMDILKTALLDAGVHASIQMLTAM